MFKKILKGLVIIIVLALIVGFFFPSKVPVERSKVINASPEAIYAVVSDFQTWETWATWFQTDPNMQITWGDKTAGEGASYSWKSEIHGNGTLTITNAYPNDSIKTKLEFEGFNPGEGFWQFTPEGDGTKVTWGMVMDVGSMPWSKWFGLFADGMMGPDFEKGLHNLDSVISAAPPAPTYTIDITQEEVTGYNYLGMEGSCAMVSDSIGAAYGMAFGSLMAYLTSNEMQPAGMPFSSSKDFSPDSDVYNYLAGVPVAEPIAEAPEGMVAGVTHTGNAVKGVHVGPYENLTESYEQLHAYITANGLTIIGDPWEEYVDDPGEVAPEAVRTFIYFPVQ